MTACNLCGSTDNIPLYKGNVKCNQCGLIFIEKIPNNLQDYYKDDYYSFDTKDLPLKGLQIFLYKLGIWTPCNRFLRTIKIVKNGNLLDIGCGSGSFLKIVKELGMNCYGVEPGMFIPQEGINIFHGTLEQAKYPDEFFDTVCLNHVLEHTDDPMATLKECKRVLKQDGIIRIAVPQTSSLAHWLLKENWSHLDYPRHLYNFSTDNLCEYAKIVGLKVKKIRYISAPSGFGVKSKFTFALLYPLSFICNRLRIGDVVEVCLEK